MAERHLQQLNCNIYPNYVNFVYFLDGNKDKDLNSLF